MHPSSTAGPPSITTTTTTFSDIPDVVLRDDILTLLDAPTLASLSCVSKCFRSLITVDPSSLWSLACGATWPSTLHPLLLHVIPSFPTRNPHLFFFSQSYTVLDSDPGNSLRLGGGVRRLISALDLRYHGDVVFSRAAETETSSGWFVHSPFWIDLIEQKEAVQTPIPSLDSPDICQELRDDLTLSWIVVDPDGKRAANLSSHKAVSLERHWLSGEVQARFSSVMGGEKGTAREYVEFVVTVTLSGSTCGGKTEVREVSMRAEDMEGNLVKGEESIRVLESGGLGGKKRGGTRRESAARARHEEFLRRKAERKEMKARKEGRLDRCLCIGFGFAGVLGLWSFLCKAVCLDEDRMMEVRRLCMWTKDLEMKRLKGGNSLGILERRRGGGRKGGSVTGRWRDEFRHRSSMGQETMEAPRRFPQHIRIPRS